MSKIMAGIFLGVFSSALFYEIFSRQYPELAEKLNDAFLNKLDIASDPDEEVESNK